MSAQICGDCVGRVSELPCPPCSLGQIYAKEEQEVLLLLHLGYRKTKQVSVSIALQAGFAS